jgi:RNA polymerase sigma factor (sigma-70 family)
VSSERQKVVPFRERLFGFIRNRVSSVEDAEDLLQDVMEQFVEMSAGPEPIEELSAWLFTVARNKITDWYRKRKQMVALPDEHQEYASTPAELQTAVSESPDELTDRTILLEEIEDALDELPTEQREAYVMHEIDGLSFQEIARATGVAIATAISRKHYAVVHVRERLRELYGVE